MNSTHNSSDMNGDSLSDNEDDDNDDQVNEILSEIEEIAKSNTDSTNAYSSVVLEGSIGIGKSRLLSILSNILLNDPKLRVLITAGNPFERGTLARPFGAYSQLINQAITSQYNKEKGITENNQSSAIKTTNFELDDSITKSKRKSKRFSRKNTSKSMKSHKSSNNNDDDDSVDNNNDRSSHLSNKNNDVDDKIYQEIPIVDRRRIVENWISHNVKSRAYKFSWLLNDDLGCDFYDTYEDTGDLDERENKLLIAMKTQLLLDIIIGIAKEQKVVILIDDVMYLDQYSWDLTKILARKAKKINTSIIVASRPVDEFVLIDPISRRSYNHFMKFKSVHRIRMIPLNHGAVKSLTLEYLDVVNVPAEVELAVRKCQGNPLFIREMLQGMIDNNVIHIDTNKKTVQVTAAAAAKWQKNDRIVSCSRCQSKFTATNRRHHCRSCGRLFCSNCAPANFKKSVVGYSKPQRHCIECYNSPSSRQYWAAKHLAGVVLEPPVTIVCVMGTWIDKLSAVQQMILKVASLTQEDMKFNKEEIFDAYPIASHKLSETLESEFNGLRKLGFIRIASVDATKEEDIRYEFLHNFLPDVLSQRMLSIQRNDLINHVNEMKERRNVITRSEFRQDHKEALTTMIMKQGFILVHKNREGGKNPWKRRYLVLRGHRMEFYRDKKDLLKENKDSALIDLRYAIVNIEEKEYASKDFVIRLDVSTWTKHNNKAKEKRAFFLATESNDLNEAQEWMYFIKFCLENGQQIINQQEKNQTEQSDNFTNLEGLSRQLGSTNSSRSVIAKIKE